MNISIKVAIADDMEDARAGIQKVVTTNFKNLIIDGVFEDGITLLEYLENNTPDLLITDIRMPGADGLQACRKLREHSSQAKIILITAYQDFEYAKQAIHYGVNDLITKPYTRNQLIDSIMRSINTTDEISFDEENPAQSRSEFYVNEAKKYIQNNYNNMNLSASMIAEHLSITPNYLGDIFFRECNDKLSSYIGQVRIKAAKKLLVESDLPIYKISEQVGMTNVNSFNRLFKNIVGMTPTDYQIRNLKK